MYDLAESKQTTVGELTGTRRKYSRIRIPEKLRELVGEDFITIEHFDDGISSTEFNVWMAYYEIKKQEEERRSRT